MSELFTTKSYLAKLLNETIDNLKVDNDSLTFGYYRVSLKDYIYYFKENKDLIFNDFIENDFAEVLSDGVQKLYENNDVSDDDIGIFYYYFVTVHVLLRIKKMSVFKYEELKNYADIAKYTANKSLWFRGQSEYKWKLVPSYYRSLKKKDCIVNLSYLNTDYVNMKISDKLSLIFNSSILDYEKLSFVQHSLAITPFLDFSKNVYSAVSFAIGNYEAPRKLIEDDAALYLLNVENKEIIKTSDDASKVINDLYVEYIGSKPRISTLTKSLFWNQFLKGTLHSEYHLIDIKTNDRMRIQDGTFVLFNKVLIIGEDIIFSTKEHSELSKLITKVKIDSSNRIEIYKEILKNDSKFHLLKMLNPYDFMIE